jgi:ferrous iron transport protein A
MTIADLTPGQSAIINNIDTSHPSASRIIEFGFTPGQQIEVINKALFSDPIEVSLRGVLIAIRKSDAVCINVSTN